MEKKLLLLGCYAIHWGTFGIGLSFGACQADSAFSFWTKDFIFKRSDGTVDEEMSKNTKT